MNRFIVVAMLFASTLVLSHNRGAVFGGVGSSSFNSGILEEFRFSSSPAFHLGALYEWELSDKVSFRPKIVLSQQGDRTDEEIIIRFSYSTLDYKTTSLNIPLNFKFFSKPYVIAGPQVGYVIGVNKDDGEDIGDLDTSFDYGFNLGVGYDFDQFFVEVNVYQGFATVIDLPDFSLSSDGREKLTNTILQVSFGYYFQKKKKRRRRKRK